MASGAAVRIDPRYGLFAAARDLSEEAQAALAGVLTGPGDEILLIEAEAWPAPPGTKVAGTLELLQMIAEAPTAMQPGDETAMILDENDAADMAALAALTEPGPWRELTHRYGRFYGFRQGGKLAAMAGQRILPAEGLAEISGVATAPEWRGKGYAAKLIRRVMADCIARGDQPFLHCYAGNTNAIRLYETLGFVRRRELVGTVLIAD